MSDPPISKPPDGVCPISELTALMVSWLWEFRLANGKLAMLDGDPGLGKSLMALDLCTRLSRRYGGIDFGSRNPFAAVWGTLDKEGVLWLTGEHYAQQKPLSYHMQHLPKDVTWFADPSGATERSELRFAGLVVREGNNSLRPGIAAVSARIENGTLRVVAGCCPHLLAEADLYRYSDELQDRRAETPVDANNHALAALRYLISKLDEHHMARPRRPSAPAGACEDSSPGHPPADGAAPADTRSAAEKERARRWWELANNPDVWTRWEP